VKHHGLLGASAVAILLTGLTLALGLGDELPVIHDDLQLFSGVAIGAAWLVAGLVGWWRRPENRSGALMTAVGLVYFAAPVVSAAGDIGASLALVFGGAWLAVAAHAFLAFPRGTLASRFELFVAAAAYAGGLVLTPAGWLFRGPTEVACPRCEGNALQVADDEVAANALMGASDIVGIGVVVAIVAILARRWRSATAPGRRVLGPVLWSCLLAALLFGATFALQGPESGETPVNTAAIAVFFLIPLGFLAGLLRTRRHRSVVADLVLELGEAPAPGGVRRALARALGDPSLELAFWLPEPPGFVNPDGGPIDVATAGAERATTALESGGEPLATLCYDPMLLDDPKLVEAVAAAARLAIENSRLQADLRAQLREVRASRARIVSAGDAERRRIERNLHDGAQQRLLGVRMALRLARSHAGDSAEVEQLLAEADAEVAGAIDDLRDLARGVHPAVLVDQGLGPALAALARRSSVRVEIADVPPRRLPLAVETAAYYLVAEGLANATKHARASRVRVRVITSGGRALIELADDGAGGADTNGGSGLRGLRDRIEALDGTLEIDSPPGEGTKLQATVPCG
jgi:signal transduction histidine kinase